MLNRLASLAMSTCVLKALPGRLDIKRHSPSILYKNDLNHEGIWKERSRVYYLSNRLTKLFMFGIILNNSLSSMFGRIFHEDVIMQTRKILF